MMTSFSLVDKNGSGTQLPLKDGEGYSTYFPFSSRKLRTDFGTEPQD